MLPHIIFQSVAVLFTPGKPVCREDAIRKICMDDNVPEIVKIFWRQMIFDDVVVSDRGEVLVDVTNHTYSDA